MCFIPSLFNFISLLPPPNMSTEACLPVSNVFTINIPCVRHTHNRAPGGRGRVLNVLVRAHLSVAGLGEVAREQRWDVWEKDAPGAPDLRGWQ